MSLPALAPAIALRIGLAARCLEGVSVGELLDLLVDHLGLPLDEANLARLGLKSLRSGLAGKPLRAAEVRQALAYLSGQTRITVFDDTPPELDPFDDGDLPGSLRVAVASNGGEMLDGEFGHCHAYLIYQLGSDELRLIDWRLAPQGGRARERELHTLNQLADCHLLYATHIGNRAAARLMQQRIHPVTQPQGGAAREQLRALQQILANNPPPWLHKATGIDTVPALQKRWISGPTLVHSR